ncbi:hypothetical protein DFH09DRAFT_1436224 [Mycena vulgaris]|nr:hypothetical protein DFH09DRAFT_1335881 [Mycena vulgaris]KAJ6509660.1 hypothetical protein DFH09DRAFT_1436224 [Mycena vulgaris]
MDMTGKGGKAEEGLYTSRPRACRHRAAHIVIPDRALYNAQLASAPPPASSPLTTVPGHVPSADLRTGKYDATLRAYPSLRPQDKTRASQDRRRCCTHSNLPHSASPEGPPTSVSPPGERAPNPRTASARAPRPETARSTASCDTSTAHARAPQAADTADARAPPLRGGFGRDEGGRGR